MSQKSHLRLRSRTQNRTKYFENFDQYIEKTKAYETVVKRLHTLAHTWLFEMCAAHKYDLENPPDHMDNRDVYNDTHWRYCCDAGIIQHNRDWLRALTNWKFFLHEVVGVLWNVRRLQEHAWNACDLTGSPAADVDEERKKMLEMLRDEMDVAQMRYQWAMAGCGLWLGKLHDLNGRTDIIASKDSLSTPFCSVVHDYGLHRAVAGVEKEQR
jgi:hypothetical protein